MRKIALLVFASLAFCYLSNAQGIEFFHGTFEEAKAKAKNENKKIFLDIYTTWCGPCKKMAAEVFTSKEVGDFFNKNFVSMKLDAENQASHDFFKLYKASSFPTYFWVDAQGELLDQKTGSCAPGDFIAMAQNAMTRSLGSEQAALKKRWDGGERSLELVQNYIIKVVGASQPEKVRPAIIEFLNTLSEEQIKTYPIYMLIKANFGSSRGGVINDRVFELFKKNYDYYAENYTSKYKTDLQDFYVVLYRCFVRITTACYLQPGDRTVMDKQFEKQLADNKALGLKYSDVYEACARAERLLYIGDYAAGIDAVAAVLSKYGAENPYLNEQLLYSLVISKYLVNGQKAGMSKVKAIADEAMRVLPNKANVTFYAAIQMADGNYTEAISALANKHFYPGSEISNAIYPQLNFIQLRDKFPLKPFPEVNVPQR